METFKYPYVISLRFPKRIQFFWNVTLLQAFLSQRK